MPDENEKPIIGPVPTREEQIAKLKEVGSDYQNYLDKLPKKIRERILNQVVHMKTGLGTIAPMICPGPDGCMFIKHCPIPELDDEGNLHHGPYEDYPIGRACVLEKFYLQQKIIDYTQHLNVDPDNPVEMAIVNELAIIDLLKNRALMLLATGDRDGDGVNLMKTDIAGFSKSGAPALTHKLHPAAEYLEKLEKRRERWLDRLVETRKAKADLKAKTGAAVETKLIREIELVRGLLESIQDNNKQLEFNTEKEIFLDDHEK